MKKKTNCFLLILLVSLVACSTTEALVEKDEKPSWSYKGEVRPANWPKIIPPQSLSNVK